MSQLCPICRTRLWSNPIWTPGRLRCPRCGAIFRPSVPWAFFRWLLLLAIVLALIVLLSFSGTPFGIAIFVVLVTLFFWFLPRFVDLHHISGELPALEGPADADQLKLNLEDEKWEEQHELAEEKRRFSQLLYLLIALLVLLLILTRLGGAL